MPEREAPNIRRAHEEAVEAAERGSHALREVWPAATPQLPARDADALRDALRSMEDGWAALLRVDLDS